MNNDDKKWIIQTENGQFTTLKTYSDYDHFESNVFMNEGYVWVVGANGKPLLIRSSEIVYAYEGEGEGK